MATKLLQVTLLVMVASATVMGQQVIKPGSKQVKALGRIDRKDADRFRFDFPGVNFTMQFSNSKSIAVKLKGSTQTFFQAFIDGKPVMDQSGKQAVYTSVGDTVITLAGNLAKGSHTVQLFKRTEGLDSTPAEFMGFIVDDKATVADAAPLYKKRRMEFLGNSITCAYGSEAKGKDSPFEAITENSYLSYANVLARAFDADVQIVAHSGRGVVRNYGDKNKKSPFPYTVPALFGRTLDCDTASTWEHGSYIPDVVVINLGTNDYSTYPFPEKSVFIDAYLKLIRKVREVYGSDVPVFCIVGPMMDEPCYSYVKEMVEMQRKLYGDGKTYFIGIPTYTMDPDKDLGASYHPGGDGEKKMAQVVAPVISTITGWKVNTTEMYDIKGGQQFYAR